MIRSIRLTFLAVLAAFLALPSGAQSPPGTWLVSTGRTRTADGTWKPLVFTADARKNLLDAVEQELAQVEVTRKHAETSDRMWRWIAMCTWSGTPQRAELLETLALRNSAFLERFGRTREALFAVEGVLVPAELAPMKDLELAPATAEDLALQAQILARPAVVAARERLRRLIEQPVADDEIRRIVSDAIQAHDRGQIEQLGKRAVPALIDIATGDAPDWMPEADDALAYLMEFDEAAAARLILEQFDHGGPFWRRRAMRAMRSQFVLRDAGTWTKDAEGTARLVETWWPPVVLRLLREPDVAAESLQIATDLAMGNALDEALTAAILEGLRTGEREFVAGVEQLLNSSHGRAGTQRILVEMLASRDTEQRAFAAQGLVGYRDVPELRAGIASSDRALRLAAVRSLAPRPVYRRRMPFDGEFPSQTFTERFDPPAASGDEIALLEAGLRDADAGIRAEAAGILAARDFAIADATWDALAADPDAVVREILARAASRAQPAKAAHLLSVLAKDVEPGVLAAVDAALLSACQQPPDLDVLLPAIRARRANARVEFFEDAGSQRTLYDKLAKTTDGAALLGAWAEEGDEVARQHAILFLRDRHTAAKSASRGPHTVDRAAIGVPFDDRRLAFLFAATAEWPSGRQAIAELGTYLRIEDAAPWRELGLDERQSLPIRLHAFAIALESRDARLVDELVRALIPAQSAARSDTDRGLRAVFDRLDPESARRVLTAVLAARPAPALTDVIVTIYVRDHELDSAAADAILAEQLSEAPAWYSWDGANAALERVAARPLAAQGNWLARSAKRPVYSLKTVQLLGELREPAYRPLLVECIDAGWLPDLQERTNVRRAAIVAIGRYLDDEAVEILLDAATRLTGSELGKACYEALERIQVHREQRAAWELRKRAGATKDAAIAELVRILESTDAAQRAQAVRSLATLGAVEELPRVVKLLKDTDAGVRAAAASALEVLNSSTAKPR